MAKPNSSNGRLPLQAKKLSISILVISLPLLYVSLLHIPPSTLFKDTTFWFLMSNSIIIIVAADSGMFSSTSTEAGADLYDQYIKHSRGSGALLLVKPETIDKERQQQQEQESSRSQPDVVVDKSIVVHEKSMNRKLMPAVDRSVSMKERSMILTSRTSDEKGMNLHHKSLPPVEKVADASKMAEEMPLRRSATEKRIDYRVEDSEYSKLSNEELNKRVEEFIRRFNREIRLQAEE